MHPVNQWLKNKGGWDEGVALYGRYGGNPRLLQVYLSAGYTKKRHGDLVYEMQKLLRSLPAGPKQKKPAGSPVKKPPATKPKPAPPSSPTVKAPGKTPIGENPSLDELYKKKNSLFKRYVAILHQLEHLPAAEREPLCLDCLDIWDEIEKMWARIDHGEKYGVVPADEEKQKREIRTIRELVQRQFTLRSYISREGKKLEKAVTVKARARAEQKLAEFNAELQDIEKRLNK